MTAVRVPGQTETLASPNFREGDPVIIAIVGYRNADDVHTCLSALACATEQNFMVFICENGGEAYYRALLEKLDGLIDFATSRPVLLDNRIEEARIGRLQPGGQVVQIYCAKDN